MGKQRRLLTAQQDALKHILACRDKKNLEERFINPFKGRGLFTCKTIKPSTFVVEYRGNISHKDTTTTNRCGYTLNKYLFEFLWEGVQWCVDASKEDGSLGRLVNDDNISPNCEMKTIVYEGKPHLCLFAATQISPGEEITFNYGDSSYPWRSGASFDGASSSNSDAYANSSAPRTSKVHSEELNESQGDLNDDASEHESVDDEDYKPPSSERNGSGLKHKTIDGSCSRQENQSDRSSDEEAKDPPRTRKNYCYICGEAQSKISRHLLTHKEEEPDIAALRKLRKNSKDRKNMLEILRIRGNNLHNQEVLKTGCGELKVRRKSSKNVDTLKKFASCLFCENVFTRRKMKRHVQRCPANQLHGPRSVNKLSTFMEAVESTDILNLSTGVKNMLSTPKKDTLPAEVLNDSLLMHLAEFWYQKTERQANRLEYIINKLRQMGRLLLILKEKLICSFEDALKPQNFSKLVEAVRAITGYSEETKSYERPSLLKSLENSLKKIGKINHAIVWKRNSSLKAIHDAEAFMVLCKKEWNYKDRAIPKDKTATLPFIRDVQLYCQYMENTAASAVQSLTLYESSPVYTALLRVTAAQVFVLNKNNAKVSQATLQSFKDWVAAGRDEAEATAAAVVVQSPFAQILSKTTMRIKVRNNRGQKVSITVTSKLLAAIMLLVEKREACGVHENNPFLFGIPNVPSASFFHGEQCSRSFAVRCGAKNRAILRSPSFHKHVARVFQILGLASDELHRLGELLGRDIPTNSEYYQTPEAVGDIAKISELLSALENGSLKRFEGKSLEEIEVPDEVEPDVEQHNHENSDAEEDGEESKSLSLSGSPLAKSSISVPKRHFRGSLLRKPGPGRRKRQASETDSSEEEVKTDRDHRSEERPRGMMTRGKKNATKMSFSDDDADNDMNVDSDMDADEEVVGDREHGDNGDTSVSPATPLKKDVTKQDNDSGDFNEEEDGSPNKPPIVADIEESMDINTANSVEKEVQQKGGKRIKLSSALTGMKKLKLVIPKLDIVKLETPVQIYKLSSEFQSVGLSVKQQSIGDDKTQCETSSSVTHVKDKPHNAKATKMSCSHCKKSLMKNHMAFQRKGFTDVFCSKKCLFKMFTIKWPVTKTCHQCLKGILQPLDRILAAVDDVGTMKDFCSPTCLLFFKSISVSAEKPRQFCSMCNKVCTSTCQVTLNEASHSFCSISCFGDFCKGNIAACEHCSTTFCHKPLKLKLEDKAKTVCSQKCLDELKENIKTPHKCTMCKTSLAVSDMLGFNSNENVVELFCTQTCVMSYRLQPEGIQDCQAGSDHLDLPEKKEATPTTQIITAEKTGRVSTASAAPAAAEWDAKPKPILPVCCNCGKKVSRGKTLHQKKSTLEVFCSAKCLSEKHPNTASVTKTCYNCFQEIIRPQSMILAPVDGLGTMKELCSPTCLASVNSKRDAAASRPPPPPLAPGFRSECRMCNKFCFCKYKHTLDGYPLKICGDACYVRYHRINNVPLSTCDVCRSLGRAAFTLKPEDGGKAICRQECLVKFKEKIESLRLCPMCQTPHQLSDMVENKNNEGMLDFFCSNRCMLVHNTHSSTVAGHQKDIKEVKPSLTDLDFLKEEPIDEEYNQTLPDWISTEGIKDEPKAGDDVRQKMKTLQPCAMCHASHLKMDMIENKNSEGSTELFCASCVMASKIRAVNASGAPFDCDQCGKTTLPACHLAMPDASIRNFCTLTCAMSFKENQQAPNASTNSTGSADQTQFDFLKPPEDLPCSQCQSIIKTTPKVIQKKGKINFVCSLACSEKFKTANNFIGQCEYCKNQTIIRDIKKVEGKTCYFCSVGCRMLFQHQLESQWGEHCGSCAYCFSASKTRVRTQHKGTDEDFCSADCSANYNMLQSCAAQCDNCGRSGELRQSLTLLEEVKRFCDLRCLLHFCNKKVQMVNTISYPRSSGTVEFHPVITNVISLASATQHVPVPGVHTNGIGHATAQTVPRELKNKSVLCTPLVHNKGVSCTTRTVDTESQTDNYVPKVLFLPVPVPMYVPVPMNMYTQYTPKPLCLPLPLPVPVFLPDPTVRSAKQEKQPEGELNFEAEMTEVQDERNKREDRVRTKKRRR